MILRCRVSGVCVRVCLMLFHILFTYFKKSFLVSLPHGGERLNCCRHRSVYRFVANCLCVRSNILTRINITTNELCRKAKVLHSTSTVNIGGKNHVHEMARFLGIRCTNCVTASAYFSHSNPGKRFSFLIFIATNSVSIFKAK